MCETETHSLRAVEVRSLKRYLNTNKAVIECFSKAVNITHAFEILWSYACVLGFTMDPKEKPMRLKFA